MSELLLTVVILGVCVAAVVADLLLGSEQTATNVPTPHREYGGPWRGWLISARRLWDRIVQSARGTWGEMGARRRTLSRRQAAHARHVAHLEEGVLSQTEYPLPPVPEWRRATGGSPDDEPPAAAAKPAALPQWRAATATTAETVRDLPTVAPVAAPPQPLAPGLEAGTAIAAFSPAAPPAAAPNRFALLDDAAERGFTVPLAVPRAKRLRSAAALIVLMSALGILTALLVLAMLGLVVHTLSGV